MVKESAPRGTYDGLFELVSRLRGEDGCPWDREQTPESIHTYLIEEAYELREAIESGDSAAICEELGDVLFHIFFLARVFEESNAFTIKDVLQGITKKMIRRHPHVFGLAQVTNADEVRSQWRRIKAEEGKHEDDGDGTSLLDRVPRDLPVLMRAYRLGQEASKVGFDWPDSAGVMAKVKEELGELEAVLTSGHDSREVKALEEFGDLLFSMVNLARLIKVHPETALWQATAKFVDRFQFVEERLSKAGRSPAAASLAEMDEIWEEAKGEIPN